jgi:hypothetical protein
MLINVDYQQRYISSSFKTVSDVCYEPLLMVIFVVVSLGLGTQL